MSDSIRIPATTLLSRLPGRMFFLWLAGALAIDLGTKQWASMALADRMIPVNEHFAFLLVYNTGGAGGYTLGPVTWYLNVSITLAAIIIMLAVARELGRLHRLALPALGLVCGGACGNLASMLTGPEGVADFLALMFPDRAIVMNVADLALWSGALLLVPVVSFLVRAIRIERTARRQTAAAAA